MKKTIFIMLSVTVILSASVVKAYDRTGNGSPRAKKLYSMNIIGVKNPITTEMVRTNAHVIFVLLDGTSKINLSEGRDFRVLDKNGTDKDGASFQLPKPGFDPYLVGGDLNGVDTTSDYSIFVRPLGKPGGYATITTCADLVADPNIMEFLSGKFRSVLNRAGFDGGYASVEQVGQDITLRRKGRSRFQDVTAELLSIVFKVEVELADGSVIIEYVRVPIFDDRIENEYWEYVNNELKLLQVRFYAVGTDISKADDPVSWDELP